MLWINSSKPGITNLTDMTNIADLLFEARLLKEIPRSGYSFLGAGRESIAEHTYSTAFIGLVMSRLVKGIDQLKLISMCMIHDLHEARTGDLNYVQKRYIKDNGEETAVAHMADGLPFGDHFIGLIDEFNKGTTHEAKLARDADQLSFILELKCLSDTGYKPPDGWLPNIIDRLVTDTGMALGASIMETPSDAWWRLNIETDKDKNSTEKT